MVEPAHCAQHAGGPSARSGCSMQHAGCSTGARATTVSGLLGCLNHVGGPLSKPATHLLQSMQLYDETRIDHFRAFAGYWAVAADAETGMPSSELASAPVRRHGCGSVAKGHGARSRSRIGRPG